MNYFILAEWEVPVKRSTIPGKLKELFRQANNKGSDETQPLLLINRPKTKSIIPREVYTNY